MKIRSVVAEGEAKLRALVAEAATAGDYAGLDLCRDVAVQLKALLESLTPGNGQEEASNQGNVATRTYDGTRLRKSSRAQVAKYPKFFIRDGVLFKVGWSRTGKKEYVHKIPKDAFDSTISAIGSLLSRKKSPLTAEEITKEATTLGQEVPIYQLYVALALLRAQALAVREGREGFVVKRSVVNDASACWTELAKQAV